MAKKARINIYKHAVDLSRLEIKNQEREEFRKSLEQIKYKGYVVEDISDGRTIIITKPGGKFSYGVIRRDDFMVWVYNPSDDSLWLISHRNIFEDVEEKGRSNPEATIKIIDALKQVFDGRDPDEILRETTFDNPCGECPEVLLKAYKWIWGQEDCNYPPPENKGRDLSMEPFLELRVAQGDVVVKLAASLGLMAYPL